VTRRDEANAVLAKADSKAGSVSQIVGVMLAIGASRLGFDPAVLALWAGAMGCSLLALLPILTGDFGIMRWARGLDDDPEQDPTTTMSRMAVFKFVWIVLAIVLMFASVPVLIVRN
jgi:hypothetical protein